MTDPIRFIATLNQDEACQVIDDWFHLMRRPQPAKSGAGLYEVAVTIERLELPTIEAPAGPEPSSETPSEASHKGRGPSKGSR